MDMVPRAILLGSVCTAALVLTLVSINRAPADSATKAKPSVKLVVFVAFDQMRGDYLDKWSSTFGKDGFERIKKQGVWYSECYYPFAGTATGPGHAAILSGASPSKTGIVNNEWYDREAATEAYCAGNSKYELVPSIPPKPIDPTKKPEKPKQNGSPDRMLAETVADVLKREHGANAKVFGVSLKDRSGILPSGKKPDGVFWFTGKFVTSTYYTDTLPAWVSDFNKSGKAEAYFGKTWERVNPNLDYDALVGPDKHDGESTGVGQGVEFPHPMVGGVGKDKLPFVDIKSGENKYYEALANSPYGNELLLDFAKACIKEEGLGQDDVPDLLTLSFSSNDLVGHAWGPDSHEVLDVTIRSDAIMADLLSYLDRTVGEGKYAVVLSADHGICPLPEVSTKKGLEAKRVSAFTLISGAEKHLSETYKSKVPVDDKAPANEAEAKTRMRWLEAVPAPNLYLNRKFIKDRGLNVEDVADELAKWMREQEGIQAVYTAKQLSGPVDTKDKFFEPVALSFLPERSGDLYVVLKPYHLIKGVEDRRTTDTGTNHGSPHDYDRHVPLMVFGPGLDAGTKKDAVTPLHGAAIAAKFLGVSAPKQAMYPVPGGLWK
jgi:predicted AlkP superfamily pyrophosphatase or phosphodiesterase